MKLEQQKENIVIFVHIPKTGGTTLEGILNRQYGRRNGLRLNTSYRFLPEEIAQIRTKLQTVQECKFIKGHFALGLQAHQYLLNPSSYITMLRNPLERVISDFYFIQRTPAHHHYAAIQKYRMDLQDYVSSELFWGLDNYQTRVLCDRSTLEQTGYCTTLTLESAKHNLQSLFPVVGVVERFDESLLLLHRAFQWQPPFYGKENVTPSRPKLQTLSKQIIARLYEKHVFDLELYAYAHSLLESQLAYYYPQGFESALSRFRVNNQYFAKGYQVYLAARNFKQKVMDCFAPPLPASTWS